MIQYEPTQERQEQNSPVETKAFKESSRKQLTGNAENNAIEWLQREVELSV